MRRLVRLSRGAFIFGIAMMTISVPSFADVGVTKYPLGMSPKTLHNKLVADKFVFEAFTTNEIRAVKRIAIDTDSGTEFPDATQSTTLNAKICAGKVFRIQMTSVYNGDRNALLIGRKLFYKYLKDNNAVNDSINLHKVDLNPRVVLGFSIDRNIQKNSEVRGTEIAKLALGTSKRITSNKKPLLEMNYFLENKWFCPN
jgi:hypothetical protein